jgi:hypothetical protein
VGALGAIPFMLGWVAATGDFGIELVILIQFFGNSSFLELLVGSVKIMKGRLFYVANRQKKVPLCRLFCIQDGLL